MRYYAEQGDMERARLLANEAVAYYKTEWKEWDAPGMGGEQAIHYYSEALSFLGRGLPLNIQLDLGDEKTGIGGVFEDENEAAMLVKTLLKSRFEQRRSGYFM
jgi:hypothetical protein